MIIYCRSIVSCGSPPLFSCVACTLCQIVVLSHFRHLLKINLQSRHTRRRLQDSAEAFDETMHQIHYVNLRE